MNNPATFSWTPLTRMDAAWSALRSVGLRMDETLSTSASVPLISQLQCLSRSEAVMWARTFAHMEALQDTIRRWSTQPIVSEEDATTWYAAIATLSADGRKAKWRSWWKGSWTKRLSAIRQQASSWAERLSADVSVAKAVVSAFDDYRQALLALHSEISRHLSVQPEGSADIDRLTTLQTSVGAMQAAASHIAINVERTLELQQKVLRDSMLMRTASEQLIQTQQWGQS